MATKVTVGLAPRKHGYFDPLTNTYLTLANPTRSFEYDETKPETMKNIVHAVLCKTPALVLYEGNLPASEIEAWKDKFTKIFNTNTTEFRRNHEGKVIQPVPSMAADRADQLAAGNADMPNAKEVGDAEVVTLKAEGAAAEEVKAEPAPAKTTTKRTTAKAAAKTEE